ncbi:MAG: hypothetical protein ACLQU1_11570 [Bryobacteraceae bacterium]
MPRNQEVQLNQLAVQTGRGTDELTQQAVAKLLAHNEWFKAQVRIGIDQFARANSSKRKKWTPAFKAGLTRPDQVSVSP